MRLDELFKLNEYGVGLVVQGVNTTVDVKKGEIKRQAKKFCLDVDENGIPPVLRTDGIYKPVSGTKRPKPNTVK